MKIKVASMICPTFHSKISSDRNQDESITDYLKKEMNKRIKLVEHFIEIALEPNRYIDNKDKHPLFFTLPEFFWNVKWSAIENKAALNVLTEYMMTSLSKKLEKLMGKFHKDDYGELVLLAGTVAVLIEIEGYNGKFYYEPLNYCLVFDNIKTTSDNIKIARSMWPKRMTSTIDFAAYQGKPCEGITINIEEGEDISGYQFKLNKDLTVDVLTKTEWAAEHYDPDDNHIYGYSIYNDVVKGCPFSINLCLDYKHAPFRHRHHEAKEMQPKIDFLLACGMELNPRHRYPQSVQYTIRNDGGFDYGVAECSAVKDGFMEPRAEIDGKVICNIKVLNVDVYMKMYLLDIKCDDLPQPNKLRYSNKLRYFR